MVKQSRLMAELNIGPYVNMVDFKNFSSGGDTLAVGFLGLRPNIFVVLLGVAKPSVLTFGPCHAVVNHF